METKVATVGKMNTYTIFKLCTRDRVQKYVYDCVGSV